MPAEANPPLVIYTDAVLAFAVVFQRFQVIAIRHPQVVQTPRLIQQQQFSPGNALNLCWQPPRRFVVEQLFCFRTGKAAYHPQTSITSGVIVVNSGENNPRGSLSALTSKALEKTIPRSRSVTSCMWIYEPAGHPGRRRFACGCTRNGRVWFARLPCPQRLPPALRRHTMISSADACKKSGSWRQAFSLSSVRRMSACAIGTL